MFETATKGSAGAIGTEILSPPLVSLLLINWNYAAYVGSAIDSIKEQDYPSLEAIIVDNGSTDASSGVIAKHVGDDRRFRIIQLDRNFGQLGAYFQVFEQLRGEFVTIVDADDVLFPNFVSSHVQVHLAVPSSVSLTSSNVVEMTAEGRALTGGWGLFGRKTKPSSLGLRPRDRTPRVSTISDADYRQLAQATSTVFSGGAPWIWGPGTANMFRRSVLALVQQELKNQPYFRAADNYLNPFCHVLGGSALIDLQLSAYRIHAANYFTLRESVTLLGTGRPEFRIRAHQELRETIEFLFSRAAFFEKSFGGHFWGVFQGLLKNMPDRDRFFRNQETLKILIDNYASLRELFGEARLLAELRRILVPTAFRAVIRGAHDGRLLHRMRLRLLRDKSKSARSGAAKLLRGLNERTARKALKAHASKRRTPADVSAEFGPVSVLSCDPPIFMTGIAFREMIGIAPAFARKYGAQPAAFLIYPCWTLETQDTSAQVIRAANAHTAAYPEHKLIFLCNSAAEKDALAQGGLSAYLLNKNFSVSEAIFRPLPDMQLEFDAVYTARFVPEKRHELAGAIARVAYLSYRDTTNSASVEGPQRRFIRRLLEKHPGHSLVNPLDNGLPVRLPPDAVNAVLNRAAVGLCLSNEEGSNYASMEYMLAGLPIVSTPSLGGRDVYFDHEYCIICEPKPRAVHDAVSQLKSRNISREYIRSRTLAKIEPDRRRFVSLVNELIEKLGGTRRFAEDAWPFNTQGDWLAWKNYQDHLVDFEKASATLLAPDLLSKDAQMGPMELRAIADAIRSTPGCSLLVFGCGNDSPFWEHVNRGGRTAFLEDDPAWYEKVQPKLKDASVHLIEYGTKLSDWISLLHSSQRTRARTSPGGN